MKEANNDYEAMKELGKQRLSEMDKTLYYDENDEAVYIENGDKICNVLIFPLCIIQLCLVLSNVITKLIRLCVLYPDQREVQCYDVEYSRIDKLDYQGELDFRICINYSASSRDTCKQLAEWIKRAVPKLEIHVKYVVEKLGWFKINDRRGYNAGDTIIGMFDDMDVSSSEDISKKYKLQIPKVPEPLARDTLMYFIKDYNDAYQGKSILVFLYFILGLFKSVYQEAGVILKFCMMLVGQNQSYKTTIASYGCSFYNRFSDVESLVHNLTGTEAKLSKVLDIEKDMTSIIDDLNKSDSIREERNQTAKVGMIIRTAANNVGRETMIYENNINAMPLFCGEYALENPSTNNRLILLPFYKDEVDKEKLRRFETSSDVLPLFVKKIIEWAIERYDDIVKMLANMKKEYLEGRAKEEVYQERLTYNYFVLGTAYSILKMYMEDNNMSDVIELLDKANVRVLLNNAMSNQIEYLELDGEQQIDYVKHIYIALANYYDEYVTTKKPVDNFWVAKCIYLKKDDYMCIPGDVLTELLKLEIGKAVSAYDIVNQFVSLGLLKMDNV